MSRTAFLRLEWLLSLALIVLSLGWAWVRGLPIAAGLVPTPATLALGGVAGAALWGTIPLLLRSPAMRQVWDRVLRPFSAGLGTRDIVAIALLSGLTEELFFRGILLPELGLVLSSLCFGALHALCTAYFVWATLVGAGFGALALGGRFVGDSDRRPCRLQSRRAAVVTTRGAARTVGRRRCPSVPTAIASPHSIG